MVLTIYKPKSEKGYSYVFDPENPGNYGGSYNKNSAIKHYNNRQEEKDQILYDINKLNIFKPESRNYIAGLIARNLIEQKKKEKFKARRKALLKAAKKKNTEGE